MGNIEEQLGLNDGDKYFGLDGMEVHDVIVFLKQRYALDSEESVDLLRDLFGANSVEKKRSGEFVFSNKDGWHSTDDVSVSALSVGDDDFVYVSNSKRVNLKNYSVFSKKDNEIISMRNVLERFDGQSMSRNDVVDLCSFLFEKDDGYYEGVMKGLSELPESSFDLKINGGVMEFSCPRTWNSGGFSFDVVLNDMKIDNYGMVNIVPVEEIVDDINNVVLIHGGSEFTDGLGELKIVSDDVVDGKNDVGSGEVGA